MKVFVAGASGAIGQPLIAELVRQGHSVTGLTRSASSAQRLVELGAAPVLGSVLDAAVVGEALRASQPEVLIDQLTSLPKSPTEISAARPRDRQVRIEGGLHLLHAAQACGVRRYIQQSSAFFLKGGVGLADESVGMAVEASPGVAEMATTYAELEARLAQAGTLETVVLRYGFFYGPQTWYDPAGASAELARQGALSIIGEGTGVWSWVHIEDAALATVSAMTAPTGTYHIVGDDPPPVRVWLPAFARFVGAPPPLVVPVDVARETLGEDAVYYGTKLRGTTNRKAKAELAFKPRRLEWL